MRMKHNVMLNPLAVFNGDRLLLMYHDTLQYVHNGGHWLAVRFVCFLFICRQLSWTATLFPLSDWTRSMLADYILLLHLPKQFNFILVTSTVIICFLLKFLYTKSYQNELVEIPYRVICLKETNCFASTIYQYKLITNLIDVFYKILLKMIKGTHFCIGMQCMKVFCLLICLL